MKTRIFKNKAVKCFTTTLFLLPFSLSAQNQLRGVVVSESGEPIIGASVKLEESLLTTQTDADGNYVFELKKSEQTSFQALISSSGYLSKTQVLTLNPKEPEKTVLSVNAYAIEEIQVTATRVTGEPTTVTKISKEDLAKNNFGQDLPILLEGTTNAVTTSDAGAGIGYTGVRIRGVDPTRTNVTVNGIPINDAESHGVFWVNMPDFTSSVESIDLQRGAGNSTNGAAAFGASINIKTDNINPKAFVGTDNAFGSFGTLKNTVKFGTGTLNNGFNFDGRLSRIVSDGYIDRASSDLKSLFLSGSWVGKKTVVKANVFAGKEITYQSWYGTPESRITGSVDEMNAYADRNYLSDAERANLLNSGRTYNFYTYDNQVDNYNQNHYQLHFSHAFNKNLNANISAHYTTGKGYYEEYKAGQDLADYGLPAVITGTDTTTSTDLIRRKWLDNDFYGTVYTLNYKKKALNLVFGGAINNYEGKHFGEVIWARFASNSEINEQYYLNTAQKSEVSNFIRSTYTWKKLTAFVDLQYRMIAYTYLGTSEVNGSLQEMTEKSTFNFFNPKAGLNYTINAKNKVFASYSVANREPVRDDFRQAVGGKKPVHEQLFDAEIGYRFQANKFASSLTLYHMNYANQLILTGQINDVGGYTRTNVDKSYRAGIELELVYQPISKVKITGNISLSQNKIKEFTEYVDNYDTGIQDQIVHSNTDLAFSPNAVAGLNVSYMPIKNLAVNWTSKYVGRQFLDNTSNEDKSIDAYFVNNFGLSYELPVKFVEKLTVGATVNNILNEVFENNGYTFGYIYGGVRTTENFYYPSAGRTFLFRVAIDF